LPSLMRRADWQHRAGYYNDERITYRRAIRILETTVGKEDPRLVDPLIRLGKSFYYNEPITDGSRTSLALTGETYLKRAVRVAEAVEDFPWLELAQARLALADYYISNETHNRAHSIYLEVWNELSRDEDRIELRHELLERPVPIREEGLPRFSGGGANSQSSAGLLTGVIEVEYTVSARGRVKNIRTEARPAEFTDMQRMVHREIRRRIFRPVLEEGVPVASGNQVFRHEFYYSEAELEELRQKKAATANHQETSEE
ncbi:MAG: hypothetical protein OEY37_10605, partial [Gammaproteobacteria bacterium]|nr:hypothetical protein [Gammaproteobacteria bacterium]